MRTYLVACVAAAAAFHRTSPAALAVCCWCHCLCLGLACVRGCGVVCGSVGGENAECTHSQAAYVAKGKRSGIQLDLINKRACPPIAPRVPTALSVYLQRCSKLESASLCAALLCKPLATKAKANLPINPRFPLLCCAPRSQAHPHLHITTHRHVRVLSKGRGWPSQDRRERSGHVSVGREGEGRGGDEGEEA
jgi:hypothetical protein